MGSDNPKTTPADNTIRSVGEDAASLNAFANHVAQALRIDPSLRSDPSLHIVTIVLKAVLIGYPFFFLQFRRHFSAKFASTLSAPVFLVVFTLGATDTPF